MKLTEEQWAFIKPLLPKERVRKDRRGRPWKAQRDVLQGILWILKTGARWKDLPDQFPPYQTCHRRFQSWVQSGVMKKILVRLVEHLQEKGKINLAETFIDASFVEAKKGVQKSVKPRVEKARKSWQFAMLQVFRSPYPLKVLHHMRLHLLKEQFGKDILKTYLAELSETKLTILIHSTSLYDDDLESNLLLPTSQIANSHQLKMAELLDATREDGKLSGFFLGSNLSEESRPDTNTNLKIS